MEVRPARVRSLRLSGEQDCVTGSRAFRGGGVTEIGRLASRGGEGAGVQTLVFRGGEAGGGNQGLRGADGCAGVLGGCGGLRLAAGLGIHCRWRRSRVTWYERAPEAWITCSGWDHVRSSGRRVRMTSPGTSSGSALAPCRLLYCAVLSRFFSAQRRETAVRSGQRGVRTDLGAGTRERMWRPIRSWAGECPVISTGVDR